MFYYLFSFSLFLCVDVEKTRDLGLTFFQFIMPAWHAFESSQKLVFPTISPTMGLKFVGWSRGAPGSVFHQPNEPSGRLRRRPAN